MSVETNYSPQVETPYSPQSPTPARSSSKFWLGIGLGVLLTAIGVALLWQQGFLIVSESRLSVETVPSNIPGPTPLPPEEEFADTSMIVFKKDNELWHILPGGQEEQLTQTGGEVIDYSQAFPSSFVAYIRGQKIPTSDSIGGGGGYYKPYQVDLYNVDTGETETILPFPSTRIPGVNLEFVNELKDVQFSDDSSLLAITTSQDLYIYSWPTKQLSHIFNIPYQGETTAGGVFSYNKPLFSTDNSLLALTKGYYEGGGSMMVDLQSKQTFDLPYSVGYGGGQRIIDWISPTSYLVKDERETELGKADFPDLVTVNYPSLKEEILINVLPVGIQDLKVFDEDTAIGIVDPGRESPFSLTRFNLVTGETNLLHTQQKSSGNKIISLTRVLGTANNQLYFIKEEFFPGPYAPLNETVQALDLTTNELVPIK
jgi:hypothetical protein